jgi:hypothetical protein
MNQSIEDASRDSIIEDAIDAGFDVMADHVEIISTANIANLTKFAQLRAARQSSQSEPVATADYIAYLYSDGNKLKIAEEMPPPDNAFPVFTTNIRFLDVARLVLDDNVDLILEHGGVKLWEALITEVNKNYAERNHEQ